MIIFLHGSDSYRRQKKEKHIVSKYLEKFAGFSFKRFDFKEKDNQEDFFSFKYFSGSQSLFETSKLCVIKNPFESDSQKDFKKIIEANFKNDNFIIIISHPSLPPKSFSFLLSPSVKSEKIDLLKDDSWRKFILEESLNLNLSFDEPSLKIISETFSGDSWGLVSELEKLSLIHQKIDTSLLRKIGLSKNYDFFYLLKNLSEKEIGKRLSALELLFIQKEDPGKILNSLAYQNGTKKSKLAKADLDVKSGRLEYEEALLQLVL